MLFLFRLIIMEGFPQKIIMEGEKTKLPMTKDILPSRPHESLVDQYFLIGRHVSKRSGAPPGDDEDDAPPGDGAHRRGSSSSFPSPLTRHVLSPPPPSTAGSGGPPAGARRHSTYDEMEPPRFLSEIFPQDLPDCNSPNLA